MWSHLPTELAVAILESATHDLVISDRPRALELALLSKWIFGLLAPIVYADMAITEANCERIRSLVQNGQCSNGSSSGARRVFSFVKRVFLAPDVAYHTPRFDESLIYPLLSSATHVAGSGYFITDLANYSTCSTSSAFRPVELRVYHLKYNEILAQVHGLAVFSRLTRLLVHYGCQRSAPVAVEHMRALVDAAPCLNELAIYLLWDLPGDNLPRSLEPVLRAALQFRRLERVILHVVCELEDDGDEYRKGSAASVSDESRFITLLAGFRDTRVSFWWDSRGFSVDTSQADFHEGKGVWRQACCVWAPSKSHSVPSSISC